MSANRKIHPYTNRGQGVLLVLYSAIRVAGVPTKSAVIRHIQDEGYYDITKHDLPPYESQTEPKYHTLLAWARKDAVMKEWIANDQRDSWDVTREGRNVVDRALQRYRSGNLEVSRCYLWTPKFKKIVDPKYEPSDKDLTRPEDTDWSQYA